MNTRRRESGFSLVELLMAMGITVGALGMATTAMTGLSSMRETAAMLTDGNQSLRASLNLMTRDLVVTGRLIPVGGIPIPSGAGSARLNRPSPAGMAQQFPAAWVTLPALSPGNALGPSINGTLTDMVTVLMVDTVSMCATGTLDSLNLVNIAANSSSATVDPAMIIDCAGGGVAAGDLIMFKDTSGRAALQMVTGVAGRVMQFAGGDAMNLNQPGAAAGTLFQLRNPDGTYPAMKAFRVFMISYYVDATTHPERPQLMRRQNLQPDRAIGVGIENLQVSYDLVDGATNPVNVATPAAANSANQIRKANVFLSGRSRRQSIQTRQFLRSSLSTQVSLRGLSFVDRYNPS